MIVKAYKLTDNKAFALSGRVLPTMNPQGDALGYEPNAALSGRVLPTMNPQGDALGYEPNAALSFSRYAL